MHNIRVCTICMSKYFSFKIKKNIIIYDGIVCVRCKKEIKSKFVIGADTMESIIFLETLCVQSSCGTCSQFPEG